MVTSPRRSSRANKGKNQRLDREREEAELAYQQQLQKVQAESARAKYSITPEQVLCTVCGTTDENYDEDQDERDMIQCEECLSWQHNECILKNKNIVPEIHVCNICDPDNTYYKTLKYEIDPIPYIAVKARTKTKAKQAGTTTTTTTKAEIATDGNNDDDGDFDDEDKSDGEGEVFSDNGEEEEDDEFQDPESTTRKRKRTASVEKSPASSSRPRTGSTFTARTDRKASLTTRTSIDDIEQKARDAVVKRFEGMFMKLLPGHKIPHETDSVEKISHDWAKKLESELFNCYHDRETGKLGKDYKEVSTRVFVNVKDLKNSKLRNSIINKSITFHKLVRMPVNELLNPDLRKEKEEAIKESTSLATLEQGKVSNIRRTHKGDIVLENEVTSNQQYDFNVGVSIDNDEKRFSQSEEHFVANNNDRKSSLYNNNINNDIDFNNDDLDDDDSLEHSRNEEVDAIDIEDDKDLDAILGGDDAKGTESTKEENDEYDPTANAESSSGPRTIWEGQTIFSGVTNFESSLTLTGKSLTQNEFNLVAPHLVDPNLPLVIDGRLDAETGDKYIDKVAETRRLILLELHSNDEEDDHNGKKFEKLFEYFHRKAKYGVIPTKDSIFIKDMYIFPVYEKLPRFLKHFHNLPKFQPGLKRLFIIFTIKQEKLHKLEKLPIPRPSMTPTSEASSFYNHSESPPSMINIPTAQTVGYEFLSSLDPNELALVNKIFVENEPTRKDPGLLISFLKDALIAGQQL